MVWLTAIFELTDLWLSHSDHLEATQLLEELLVKIPSYKFVPLTYQIFSRLGKDNTAAASASANASVSASMGINESSGGKNGISSSTTTNSTTAAMTASDTFHRTLIALVYRICCDHPHQTVWQLFSLAHADLVDSSTYKSNISSSRCETAKSLIQRLKLREGIQHQPFRQLIDATDTLLKAYITLAEASTEKFQKINRIKSIQFRELCTSRSQTPFNECISDMCMSVTPSVPTQNVPIQANGDYSNIVRLSRFSSTFCIAESGISRPKIIEW